MSDEWSRRVHRASYHLFPLHVLGTRDDLSRSLVEHKYTRRDGANIEDQGGEPRRVTLDLIFADGLYGGESVAAYHAFMVILQDGEAHTLIHPLTGAFTARPGQISADTQAEERGVIRMSVEFLEHSTDQSIFELREGSPAAAGVEEVRSAGAELDAALAELGQASTAGADALAVVERWSTSDELLTRRDLDVQLTRTASAIDQEISRLEVATDISTYPTLVALQRLLDSVRRAAEAILATTPRVTEHYVAAARPLLAICQDLYGGALALERFEQLLRMNRIDNPALLEAGTTITVVAP